MGWSPASFAESASIAVRGGGGRAQIARLESSTKLLAVAFARVVLPESTVPSAKRRARAAPQDLIVRVMLLAARVALLESIAVRLPEYVSSASRVITRPRQAQLLVRRAWPARRAAAARARVLTVRRDSFQWQDQQNAIRLALLEPFCLVV